MNIIHWLPVIIITSLAVIVWFAIVFFDMLPIAPEDKK